MSGNGASQDVVELRWSYSPADYFGEKVRLENKRYVIEFEKGFAIATIPAAVFDRDDRMLEKMGTIVQSHFLIKQVYDNRPFELERGLEIRRLRAGRTISNAMVLGAAELRLRQSSIDVIYADSEGNVHNPEVEMEAERPRFEELAFKYLLKGTKKKTIKDLVESFHAAAENPENIMLRLYEIKQRVLNALSGEEDAKSTLEKFGVSKEMQKRFDDLTCDMPLTESRHRGSYKPEELRPATSAERSEARAIARKYILAYLEYLESKGKP